jgi:hypothetical protein
MPLPLLALGIGAGVGGLLGLISTGAQSADEQAQLRRQKELAWSQYLLGQNYSDAQFSLDRREAVGQLALQERRLDESLGRSVAEMNTGLLGQAYAAQDARIQTAEAVGASLAAEGASGARGGSGGGLLRAYQQQSLDRGLGLQQRQNDQALSGLMAQASDARQDLGRERASWGAGGYRYESKLAKDDYNKALAELGQTEFDWRVEDAAAGPLDYVLGALGGASSGMYLGAAVNEFSQYLPQGLPQSFSNVGYGEAGKGYTNNGMSLDWRVR